MKLDTVLVDRYQIREQLSRKVGRRTFLAQDIKSKNLVIIKILKFDEDFQWDDLKLFEREASTLQHLSHPAIPEYLDYFDVEMTETRGFALVQTYIEAPSLESVVKAGRKFSEAEVMELADKLLSILIYLHEQNPPVIHRDIKPSNILLTNRSGNSVGDVYLVDFGSVQTAASKDGGTITIVGSYGYMPLEQFGGKTTPASDLYSLGMTIIYLLTGTHPAELPQVNGQVKFTADISRQLRRWLEKTTQPHLEKRFNSAQLAQISLKSEDGSYGDFMHLKPANSSIELYRDQDKLEIRLPFYSVYEDSLGSFLLLVIFLAIVFIWHFSAFWPLIVFSTSIIFHLPYPTGALERKIVSIDSDSRILKTGTFLDKNNEVKWDNYSVLLQCNAIEYSPSYTLNRYTDQQGNLKHGKVEIDSGLYFRDQYNYQHLINYIGTFSEATLWWLGQEISDFLDMELQVIYATPKLAEVSDDL